jgi:outer membrane receptor protein involved in Fe transport
MRITLEVGALTETVTVMAEAAVVRGTETVTGEREARQRQQAAATPQSQAASQNVLSLQRRASGVLPVRIDIPRAGRSYVLVRPLVVDEETTVRFDYKTR